MASLITHPAVPIAAALVVGRAVVAVPLLVLGIAFSMLPDLDVIGSRLGIAYGSPYAHRGFSHSIVAALLLSAAVVPIARALKARPVTVFWFLSLSMLSHGILDAFTRNATNGVALFWPLSSERILFSFRPIEASPLSLQRFMSERGLQALSSEMVWVWTPLLAIGFVGLVIRRNMTVNKQLQPTRGAGSADQ
jgi:inner membrane protein